MSAGGPGAPADRERDAALVAEALRVNARYLDEVVIGWGLCPWAARALADGDVRREVLLDERPDVAAVVGRAVALAADPSVTIGLLVFPRATLAAPAFDSFAEKVRRAAPRPSAFLLAAFHPFAATSFDGPAQLVAFVRRAPDPTLQLVRASALARLPATASAEVGRQNHDTVQGRGAAALEALLRDIRADRDRSYARLGA